MPYHGSTLAEDAGAYDREHLRVDAMIVVEAVDDSARDEQHLAGAYVGLPWRLGARQPCCASLGIRSRRERIKELYDHRCQMCGTRLEGLAGPYAEAAHVRPLGSPHNGPDTLDNILCLCPNHHVLFDHGGVGVAEDLTLVGAGGSLTVDSKHRLSESHLSYRREHYQIKG